MREEIHQQRRAKILGAARQMFLTKGFDRATVSEVARLAKVSSATVYIHFATKDRLFEAATNLALAPYEGLFDEIDRMDGDPTTVLTRFAEVYFQFLAEPDVRSIYRIVGMEAAARPEMARAVHENAHRLMGAILRRQMVRFHAAGQLVIADTAIAARLFQGMIEHSALTIPLLQGQAAPLHPAGPYCAEAVRVFLGGYNPN
ncbi:MAG: transcriptional regulator, TetR family [Caulobacter sp.]|nr:transcriptional regulator, TetR family [Caulobacter sp.]